VRVFINLFKHESLFTLFFYLKCGIILKILIISSLTIIYFIESPIHFKKYLLL